MRTNGFDLLKARGRDQAAHARHCGIEHSQQKKAKIGIGSQFASGISFSASLGQSLQARQQHGAKMLDQLPVAKLRLSEFTGRSSHAHSKADSSGTYKLQSGDRLVAKSLQLAKPNTRKNPAEQNWRFTEIYQFCSAG